MLDRLLRVLQKRPYRCRGCKHRFYRHFSQPETVATPAPERPQA